MDATEQMVAPLDNYFTALGKRIEERRRAEGVYPPVEILTPSAEDSQQSFNEYMIDAQPVIPIDTASVNWVKKAYVKGMYPNPGSLFPWKYVYIERDQAKWDYGTPSLAAD